MSIEEAKTILEEFDWGDESLEYLNMHLARFCATMDFLDKAGLSPTTRVLEVGAAPFQMTRLLYERFTELSCIGSDANAEVLVGRSGQRRYLPYFSLNIETDKWPQTNESLDLVVCTEVLEHMILDPMAALSEMNRVLATGGRLLVSVPNAASHSALQRILQFQQPNSFPPFRGNPYLRHNREWTDLELAELLRAAGFYLERWGSIFARPTEVAADVLSEWRRGDTLLVLARKIGPVKERYPTTLDLYFRWDHEHN
jgi:SAM-dependent methyltransferase